MRRLVGVLVLGAAAAGATAQAQTAQQQADDRRAAAIQRQYDRCAPHSISAGGCPSMQIVTQRFDRQARARETRALFASIEASLRAGDCEGARAQAVDEGRHELAARIRRACKRAS